MRASLAGFVFVFLNPITAICQGPFENKPLKIPAGVELKKADRETALLLFKQSLHRCDVYQANLWSRKVLEFDIKSKKPNSVQAHVDRLRELLAKTIEIYEMNKEQDFQDSQRPGGGLGPAKILEINRHPLTAAQFYYLEALEQLPVDEKKRNKE